MLYMSQFPQHLRMTHIHFLHFYGSFRSFCKQKQHFSTLSLSPSLALPFPPISSWGLHFLLPRIPQLKVPCRYCYAGETRILYRVILVNMVISVILGHEKTKIQNILDLGKIDVFSVRTNIYIKNKKMGHLI